QGPQGQRDEGEGQLEGQLAVVRDEDVVGVQEPAQQAGDAGGRGEQQAREEQVLEEPADRLPAALGRLGVVPVSAAAASDGDHDRGDDPAEQGERDQGADDAEHHGRTPSGRSQAYIGQGDPVMTQPSPASVSRKTSSWAHSLPPNGALSVWTRSTRTVARSPSTSTSRSTTRASRSTQAVSRSSRSHVPSGSRCEAAASRSREQTAVTLYCTVASGELAG